MITSLHYYSYYKPRLLKNYNSNDVAQVPFKKSIANTQTKPYSLSTAYKDDVISYAKDLSDSVNNTKYSSNETINLLEEYLENDSQKDKKKFTFKKQAEKELDEKLNSSLKNLVKALNKSVDFKNQTSQSSNFNEFSKNLLNIANDSVALSQMGLTFNDGKYEFEEQDLSNLNSSDKKDLYTALKNDIENVNDVTKDFLSEPLSKHMSFKNFSYYYSYASGIVKKDSFGLFSTGTLVDLEL